MSAPEIPVETEARQILQKLDEQGERIDNLTAALNGLGSNVQWALDNLKGIFDMMGNPMAQSMLGSVMAGAMGGIPDDGQDGPGPAAEDA